MANRAYRDKPSRRPGRYRRDLGRDRGLGGASGGSFRGLPLRDRPAEGGRADLEEGTLRGRRTMDRLSDLAPASSRPRPLIIRVGNSAGGSLMMYISIASATGCGWAVDRLAGIG